jgi:hypothetical protein
MHGVQGIKPVLEMRRGSADSIKASGFDPVHQHTHRPFRGRAFAPGVIAADRNPQHSAHRWHRIVLSHLFNHAVAGLVDLGLTCLPSHSITLCNLLTLLFFVKLVCQIVTPA